jgi:3-oxosteroid 1-dehydrogenase
MGSEHECNWDLGVDVLIAGSGAAALSAALTASMAGLIPLVVEGAEQWGGTTAMSGGGVWAPANGIARLAGIEDSPEAALAYLESVVGDVGPASSLARRKAYIEAAPQMAEAFESIGFDWSFGAHYPDYHFESPGARTGRMLEAAPFDLNRLGPWAHTMRRRDQMSSVPIMCDEMARVLHTTRTRTGFATTTRLAARSIGSRIRGRRLATMGMGLVAQLMFLLQRRGVAVWLSSPLRELVTEDGVVTGAVVEREGRRITVRASRGVVLGVGGFAQNESLRHRYSQPVGTKWSIAIAEDRGDGLMLGLGAGADVALMDDSWWVPMVFPPDDAPNFVVWERAVPHSIMVDHAGQRFVNEAASYQDVGARMLERDRDVSAVPSWLIIDANHRRRYSFGMALPGITPRRWLSSGFMVKAGSLEELARRCEIHPAGLLETVERFNRFASTGIDEDFGRGSTEYDNYYADPTHSPNPSLGPVEKAPYYAVRVYPGDVGSKGGLLADEHSRVLRPEGSVVEGLYAAGNTSASMMGHRYPGPGSTVGSALTWGYIAMRHATHQQPDRDKAKLELGATP